MTFTPEHLLATLIDLIPSRHDGKGCIQVAYSGGMDSHVLLHALVEVRASLPLHSLCAVHVHHGLHPDADIWARHCEEVCMALDVDFTRLEVDAGPRPGESREARAREVRYAALAGVLDERDCLLTAHHQDDQAETVLLQLLRGAGPRGLAAMPERAVLGPGWLVRPLLAYTRAMLREYAECAGLCWVEDQSNADTGLDRNYLRHEILPQLKTRWPAVSRALGRSAAHNAEVAGLLEALGSLDLAMIAGGDAVSLPVQCLQELTVARRRNVLRHWLRSRGLPAPGTVHLDHILSDALAAARDRSPCVRWPGAEVRRYRDKLYAMVPLPPPPGDVCIDWDIRRDLSLPGGAGTLTMHPVTGSGLHGDRCRRGPVTVRFRRGGEVCRPAGREHHHELKKLFQETGVAPWARDRIPLVYIGDDLAAVAGYWICHPYLARSGEPGLQIEWHTTSS